MFHFHRIVVVWAVAIPLALILGYLVASPDRASIEVMGLVLFVLFLPLLLQWNYWLLIFFWNSVFVAGFLPGELPLRVVFGALAFGIAAMDHVMGHKQFLRAPELTKPLLLLAAVVVFTMKMRGGIGLRTLGSEAIGGKHYIFVLGAIISYFALTSQAISPLKSARAVKLFFLPGITHVLIHLVFALGPVFYILYLVMSPIAATDQAAAASGMATEQRFGGLAPAATAVVCFVLARWGLRGVFTWTKPWRLFWMLAALTAGLFSGFRSGIAFVIGLIMMQFMVEGLWKTILLPVFLALVAACILPMMLFANKMPYTVQRSIAFLPSQVVEINPAVREDADNSSRWRYEMWNVVWPEVPKYLLLGKGYTIDPTDLFLTSEAGRMGLLTKAAGFITAGDYHNGGLSLLIPFGAFGAAAFLWLLWAGIKVLYYNRRYGDPRLKQINDLLLAYFLTQCVFYFFVFGAFDSQLYLFLGILGMSVCLNGGVRRKESAKAVPAAAASEMLVQPA